MRVIRQGDRNADVKRWQNFLIGQGFDPGPVDGIFGLRTHESTLAFQARHGLLADGLVGNRTIGQAMLLGMPVVEDRSEDPSSTGWPAPPSLRPLTSNTRRASVWGRFQYEPAPIPSNPERIRVLGDWAARNITSVEIPQLRGIRGAPSSARMEFHTRAADQLRALWQEWEDEGLLRCISTWDGGYVPRFVRGSRTTLSNHAFGTAFDINAQSNPLGSIPATMGRPGCVRELVEGANKHGFYWGGHFRTRPDGMHFEVAERP
jgi:peptidoglycan hydrolase-like protein with peptidoglycan-binding domain